MAADPDRTNLEQIKHIVVVMMENRSFDHMLGHRKLDGKADIEGLSPELYNLDPHGNKIPITPFDADAQKVQRHGEALQKRLDPDHSPGGVAKQIGKGYGDFPMGGFVQAFVESRKAADNVGEDLWMVPMGYYTAKDLPVYEFLADHYCVCDHWHSSIPGDTWPNRLYSLAGRAGAPVRPDWFAKLPGPLQALKSMPIFDVSVFTHQLADKQWRWYSHDPATPRAADSKFREAFHLHRDNFAFFDRKKVSPATQAGEALIVSAGSFLDDAANGQLRDVSWIDPNFIDLDVLDPNSNDDHPPSDIRAGQAFILELYETLARSPQWPETLLVIVYDEHGGFYDHVVPPPIDDGSGYSTLGVRVPAILVGPRVKQSVCHALLDHTVLIKTILTRFAADPDHAIKQMGKRVENARHLGIALQGSARTDIPEPTAARAAIDAWRGKATQARLPNRGKSQAADGAGQPLVLHDFQQDFVGFALGMRLGAGLPPGQP